MRRWRPRSTRWKPLLRIRTGACDPCTPFIGEWLANLTPRTSGNRCGALARPGSGAVLQGPRRRFRLAPVRALHRLGRDPGALGEALAVLGRLHPRDDEALNLGRSLEQLVDLRVPEPLLERRIGRLGDGPDEVHAGPRGPHRDVAALELRHRALTAGHRDPVAAHP